MKIVALEATNVKRLKAVHIEPDGSLVVIGGKNGAGKTSVLDSIAYALGGKALCPSKPIRDGEEKACARVDLGEFVVERTWTEKDSYLRVTSGNGFSAKSPQTVLDGLVGRLSFDPLAFTAMTPRDQVEALKELVGLDFADLDAERDQVYHDRTEIGRDVKRLEGQLAGMPVVEDAPEKLVSVAELMEKLKTAQAHNARYAEAGRVLEDRRHSLELAERKVKELEGLLKQARATLSRAQKDVAEGEEALKSIMAIDTAPWEEQIADADELNAKHRAAQERTSVEREHMAAHLAYDDLTAKIAELDNQKRHALAEAAFPVEGLSFDEDRVLLNGIPFDQASSAEQLRVSVAMGLAANPELRVLLIRDGSLLDDDNLALVAKMAEEAEAQVWLERVSDGPEVSVLIEDGEVAERVSA